MKILVIATRNPDQPAEAFAPLLGPEARTAMALVAENFIREIYSRADGNGAVIICEADDEATVADRLGELPLAKAGLLSFAIHPLLPYRAMAMAAERL